jgi:hypothetical protein
VRSDYRRRLFTCRAPVVYLLTGQRSALLGGYFVCTTSLDDARFIGLISGDVRRSRETAYWYLCGWFERGGLFRRFGGRRRAVEVLLDHPHCAERQ